MLVELKPFAKASTFEAFCKKHELSITVNERQHGHYGGNYLAQHRYWATFNPMVEEMINGMLGSPCGNGNTPEEAVVNLAEKTRGKRLVIGAYSKERREFCSPNDWTPPRKRKKCATPATTTRSTGRARPRS